MFSILDHVIVEIWNVPSVNLGHNSRYSAMFGILDHITITTRTCYSSKLECTLTKFSAKWLIKLNVCHHKSCYENMLQFPLVIVNTNVHVTHNIFMIIETIVFVGRTYKPILAITQPRSMSFLSHQLFCECGIEGICKCT